MGYESFFYTFDDLPRRATYAQIRRKVAAGARRQAAFAHFVERYPEDVEYRLGYLESYAENGVYDDGEFQDCFDRIDDALKLRDSKGAHAKLRGLLADLQRQQREMLEEAGGPFPEGKVHPDLAALRSGEYGVLEEEFAALQQSVTPRGILGGEEERRFWQLFQWMIEIAFAKGDPELAIERVDRYEEGRIAVKLTPIPGYRLQEMILGYLAQQSIDSARARLAHWLAHSRSPCVPDTVKQHEAFRDLCDW